MKRPLFACAALVFGVFALASQAKEQDGIVSLGQNTYAATRTASTGWARNTDKLKAKALEDAAAYCAKLNKELKVLETKTDHPSVPLMGMAYAKVVFKALDANDPELHTPVVSATSPGGAAQVAAVQPPQKSETAQFYDDLMLLDDLRKRGLLTEEQFEARKQKLLDGSK